MVSNNFLTATVITDSDLILYFTNFFIEDGFLILFDNQKFLYTDSRYYFDAKLKANATTLLIEDNSLLNFIRIRGINEIKIVDSLTTAEFYKTLLSFGVSVTDDSENIFNLTSVKTTREIELIKNSCSVLEKSLINSLTHLKEGITESEFAGILEYEFKLNGGEKPAFDTIVSFGEGSAVPHYKTSNVKLKMGMPVLIDAGVKVNGYCSDITRSFYFGKAPEEYIRAHSAVLNAHIKAFNEIKVGSLGSEADNIARSYLKSVGLDKYFTHSLGHGVGVKIHEFPRLSKKSNSVIKDGAVFTIEPGVYFDGKFGIRIEDTVYFDNGTLKSLFNLGKDAVEFIPRAK